MNDIKKHMEAISNLIVDMTLGGASDAELTDMIKLSMDIILILRKIDRSEEDAKEMIYREDVLKLLEEIRDDSTKPKNYGTILDIMQQIRCMPAVCDSGKE